MRPLTRYFWLFVLLWSLVASLELFAALAAGNDALVRVENRHRDGSTDWASGAIVDWGGRPVVLSCFHLLRDGIGEILVYESNGRIQRAAIAGYDGVDDVLLLTIGEAQVRLPVASARPEVGEPIISYTYVPFGFRAIRGRLQCYRLSRYGQQSQLVASGRVRHGDSGSPLLNDRGELVAVAWGGDSREIVGTDGSRVRYYLTAQFGNCYIGPNGMRYCTPSSCRPMRTVPQTPLVPIKQPQPSAPTIDLTRLKTDLRTELTQHLTKELRDAIAALPKPQPAPLPVPAKPGPNWFDIRYVNEETGEVRYQRVYLGDGFTFTDHGLSPVEAP